MTLEAAIRNLQTHSLSVTGIKAAPADPPDSLSVFPFALAYPEGGRILGGSAQFMRGIHIIIVEFHVNRTLLPAAIATAKGYIEEYAGILLGDPTLGGEVDTIILDREQNITYEFGVLEWAGVQTIGVRFHIPVKIESLIP